MLFSIKVVDWKRKIHLNLFSTLSAVKNITTYKSPEMKKKSKANVICALPS